MFRRGFLWRFLAALVIIGLLAAGGGALYRVGWMQGYQTGALTAAAQGSDRGTGNQVAPQAPGYGYGPWMYGPRFYGHGFGFFPFFPFFGIGFFLLVFILFGAMFRWMIFRRVVGGPGPFRWNEEEMKAWYERHSKPEGPAENQPPKE
jgi:hypothetical protein